MKQHFSDLVSIKYKYLGSTVNITSCLEESE